jgi:aldehyde dehydrogenase (NAD+)
MSSWNYPVYTALPAVGAAIAAGNAVILKPSELAQHTSQALRQLFQNYLDPRFYRIIEGGPTTARYLTEGPAFLEEEKLDEKAKLSESDEKKKNHEDLNSSKEANELWDNFKSPFDLIIFTGSTEKGRKVAEAAGRRLVPCLLELGGKSPVIVDEGAKLDMAADKIAFGRLSNCGQTCVAPDYLFVHASIKQARKNNFILY